MQGKRLIAVDGTVEIETFTVPEPGPGQGLVRVSRSQVSAGSEKNGLLGRPERHERHELGYTVVGQLEALGNGTDGYHIGDRVLAFGSHGSHWLTGQANLSELRGSLQPIPHSAAQLSDEQATFAVLGDVALLGVRRAQLQIDESVAVFGQGVVGQLTVALCRASGAYPIIAVDLDEERLELARASGATHTVRAQDDPVAAIREITGDGAQCVFHAARDPHVLVPAMQAAGDRGKVILVGSPPGSVEIGLQVELLRRELDIRGVYGNGLEDNAHPKYPWTRRRNRQAMMRMIASGLINVDPLISHVAKPEEAPALYQQIVAGTAGWMSILFDWD
jgi:threonine dehydrogenase-like Zn-dependent dehydrogenase